MKKKEEEEDEEEEEQGPAGQRRVHGHIKHMKHMKQVDSIFRLTVGLGNQQWFQ